MSYSAYTPFRINSNKCSECPEKEIITKDKNELIKTKKLKCAFALKFGLYCIFHENLHILQCLNGP